MEREIAVIGAGAAGMMAAITAASQGAKVTVFEKKSRVLQKILVTGNGKCNLSNINMDVTAYHSSYSRRLEAVLHTFSTADTISFFNDLGVLIRAKNGYLYPYSEQAQVVLDALRLRADELGISILLDHEIKTVTKRSDGFFAVNDYVYEKIIIACGSMAAKKKGEAIYGYAMAEMFGHTINPVVSGLCKLFCREGFLKALSGVRCQAEITLVINGATAQVESGEVQFTNEGISGIPVFQLSRTASYALLEDKEVKVKINFFPDMAEDDYENFCFQRLALNKGKSLSDFLLGMAHKKINQVMIRKHGFSYEDKIENISSDSVWKLLMEFRSLLVRIRKSDSFENAQVCAGGVDLNEVSDELESVLVPGLYFAGEILDVDGRCGGYNLQWAWSSGFVAGGGVR